MKTIELTQGKVALVDDADYAELSKHKWYASKDRSGDFYAARYSPRVNGKHHTIRMSRQILGLEHGDKQETNHIHHNTLDNRRYNLRICTHSQNQHNQKSQRQIASSEYKGVGWYKRYKKWCAYIKVNGKPKHLGYFTVEIHAAMTYDEAAIKYFGEFACLNFKLRGVAV